jgi:hypothetical protein
MDREITVKLHNTAHFVKLFNGFFSLTNKEIEVLSMFIDQIKDLEGTGINPFSTESKKIVAKKINLDDFNQLNLYLKRLVDKKALKKMDDNYRINPLLMPLDPNAKIIIECQTLKKN